MSSGSGVLRKFLFLQVSISLFALLVTVYAAYRVVPLIKQRAILISQIAELQADYYAKHREVDSLITQKKGLIQEIDNLNVQKNACTAVVNTVASRDRSATETLKQTLDNSPELARSIPRIYIHMNGSKNIGLADRVQQILRAHGFVVFAPDNGQAQNLPDKLQVKFFRNDNFTNKEADQIMSYLAEGGIPGGLIQKQYNNSLRNPPARKYAIYLPHG